MKHLNGRIAAVTGTGRGIGQATAVALAKKGCHLVLNDMDPELLCRVKSEIESTGQEAISFCADMSTPEAADQLIEAGLRHFGRIDILVNNAGIAVAGFVDTAPVASWLRMMDVNFWGYVYTTRAVLPGMIARGSGHIVYLSSISGLMATAQSAAYSTSKFAVNSLAESTAGYTHPFGIGVSLVCPGPTATGIDDRTSYWFHDEAEMHQARSQLHAYIAQGKPAKKVAARIVRAIQRNQFMVYTQWYLRWLQSARLLFPQAFIWGSARTCSYLLHGQSPDSPPSDSPSIPKQK